MWVSKRPWLLSLATASSSFSWLPTPLKVFLHSVLVLLARAALLFLASIKFSIQQLTGHAMIIHPDDISHPLQLDLDEYGLNPGNLCTVQDLEVCDMVLPADANYGTEGTHTKVLQLVNMPVVQCPSLIFIHVLYSMCQHACEEEIKQDWG